MNINIYLTIFALLSLALRMGLGDWEYYYLLDLALKLAKYALPAVIAALRTKKRKNE